MKKVSLLLLVCSILLFSACSSDEKKVSSDSTIKQEIVNSSSKEKTSKETSEKKKAEEVEKKRQEEISKKVLEADTVMKAAEANPTDETISAAKAAIEAIPGGNAELLKRLETTTQNLESIKQQASAQEAQQQQATEQAQQTPDPGPTVITGAPPMTEQERQDREYYARLNEQLARENGIDPSQKQQTPPTHVDDQGRSYIFENHDAYKDEPYYVGE
jgi:hypothetical protein|nr:MAG TPA: protein of unknown function (DUF4969) [Caudoviricetes sp.]